MKLANLWESLFFSWFSPTLRLGAKQTLTAEDLVPLFASEQPETCGPRLREGIERARRDQKSPHLLFLLLKMDRPLFLASLAMILVHSIAGVASPYFLRSLLKVLGDFSRPRSEGYRLAGAMFFCSFVAWGILHQCFRNAWTLILRMQSALVSEIYRKVLLLSQESRVEFTEGVIVNLAQNDAFRVALAGYNLILLLLSSAVILSAMGMLYFILGPASLAGPITLIIFFPLSQAKAKRIEKISQEAMSRGDQRISIMSNLLGAIRTVKLYGWENGFLSRISRVRAEEVSYLKECVKQAAFLNLVFMSSPMVVALVTFATFVALGGKLSVAEIFPSLAVLGMLRSPIMYFPNLWVATLEGRSSSERIGRFLNAGEVETPTPPSSAPSPIALPIAFQGASFGWGKAATLGDLDFTVQPGELIAVIGTPGSGKSTLLSALTRELAPLGGKAQVYGKISYAAQQPWILNRSVKENIVFGEPWDAERYQQAMGINSLIQDLQDMPGGDAAILGEKGINLSGGQKQRIALARAFNRDADLYLLDDPFSALDFQVAKRIFESGIVGLLQGKTRILATHRMDFAEKADRILLLENGRIVDVYSPRSSGPSSGKVAQLIENYKKSTSALGASPTHSPFVSQSDLSLPPSPSVPASAVEPEFVEEGSVQKEIYLSYFAKLGSFALLAGILSLFTLREALSVFSDYVLARGTTWQVQSGVYVILAYAVLGGLSSAVTYLRALILMNRAVDAAQGLHEELLRGVLRAKMVFFETIPIGRIINRFSRDTKTIDRQIPESLLDSVNTAFLLISTLLVLIIPLPLTVLPLIPLALFYGWIQRRFRSSARQMKRIYSASSSPVLAHFSETLNGLSTIRVSGKQKDFVHRFETVFVQNLTALFNLMAIDEWLGVRLDLIGAAITGVAAIVAVTTRGQIPLSIAGISVSYAMMFTGSLARAVRTLSSFESEMTSVERSLEYSKLEPEKWEGREIPQPAWPKTGEIEISNLGMKYRPNLPPAIRKISCHIRPGEKVGVVGRTGSGKSSIFVSLLRLVEPSQGTIRVDGIDLSTVPLEVLRSKVTIIPQDPVLFEGSLRFNLDPLGDYSDPQIFQALGRAHLNSLIERLPLHLETPVHEGGRNFSVGERQLFCLARALLRNSKVLLMDEATANMDFVTDQNIQQTVAQEFKESTVITIAHRLHTVMNSDRILVMEKGSLIEFDSPEKLKAKAGGAFQSMILAEMHS